MDKQALLESLKEVGRLAFFAAVAAVVGWLGQKVNAFDPTSLQYIVLTALLRLVDKYVHVTDKTSVSGIAPF